MSLPSKYDIEIYRGDAFSLTVVQQDEAGAPIDLSGMTFAASIRKKRGDDVALATFGINDAEAALGILVLTLDDSQTKALPQGSYWDLEDTSQKRTYLVGKVRSTAEVTK